MHEVSSWVQNTKGDDNSLPNKRTLGILMGRRKLAKNNLPRKIERSRPDFWIVEEETRK